MSKAESKPYTDKKDNKLLVDVNYLFTSYPPVKSGQKEVGQKIDTGHELSIDNELTRLKNKLALYEQEIRHKEELLNEKDGRIMDLQKAMLLLKAPPKEQEQPMQKKWWIF